MRFEPIKVIETRKDLHDYILQHPYDVRFLPDGTAEVYITNRVVAVYKGDRVR